MSIRSNLCKCFLVAAGCFVLNTMAFAAATCKGKFPNPITDVCWSCTTIKFAGTALGNLVSGQEDTPSRVSGEACYCGSPPKAGVHVSFWEPIRRADVVRQPFCMASLGGISMDPGVSAPGNGRNRKDAQTKSSFYQAHWYVDPLMFLVDAVLGDGCMDRSSFDVAYLTELDPLWNDDELTRILNPEVFLFGNPVAYAACAADCVTATAGFPKETFFWCAGCNGGMFPMNGNVISHVGGVQASSLIMTRLIAKMHREGLMSAAQGEAGMCGYYPQPVMDKTGYKYSMLYPVAQTTKIAGRCCQPLGRSTMLWAAGREFPIEGEDFAYQVFRKRDCCQGAISIAP